MATYSFSLTVSEGKRLIAKGILAYGPVREAMEKRTVLVGSGSTNSYIAQEVLGEKEFTPTDFVTGRTLPKGMKPDKPLGFKEKPVRIRKGEIDRVDDWPAALEELGEGDVLFKGINAIGGDGSAGAVLIGHPTSGGIGACVGICVARRVRLMHPAGLEKTVPMDLRDLSEIAGQTGAFKGPTLFVSPGEVFHECHALEALFPEVDAYPYAAGGIGGAEGAAWILVEGPADALERLEAYLGEEIHGEPPFVHSSPAE